MRTKMLLAVLALASSPAAVLEVSVPPLEHCRQYAGLLEQDRSTLQMNLAVALAKIHALEAELAKKNEADKGAK